MHTRMCVCLINKRACVRTHEPSYYDVMIVSKGGRIDWSLRCDPPPPSLNHAAMSPRHGSIRAISASSSHVSSSALRPVYNFVCVVCLYLSVQLWYFELIDPNQNDERRRRRYGVSGLSHGLMRCSDWKPKCDCEGAYAHAFRCDKYQFYNQHNVGRDASLR